ncbi:MFS transporter [Pseudoscardovia radai]|uniref:MFS transporter n=1 Tax=Pseudoscardovia radai TaxID=987066 RepID=UPI0039949571
MPSTEPSASHYATSSAPASSSAPAHVPWRTKCAIVSIGLLTFAGILTETSMNVTFPTLIGELGVSLATVQWLTTGYLLLVTIVMSTTAWVLKRFAPRALFLFALAASAIGVGLCLVAPSFPLLLVGRMVQACATGIATPLMYQLIFMRVPLRRIGSYVGFASIIISLAPALGPTYGGIMTSVWSWRAIFVGVLPVLVFVAVLGAISVRGEAPGVGDRRFDIIGVALLAALFTMVLLAFSAAGRGGWGVPTFWIDLAVCALVCAALAWHTTHGSRRVFDYSILRIRMIRLRLFGYFGLQFTNIGLSFVLPLFVQNVFGATAMQAGLMLLPGALLGAVASPIAGRMYDRRGARGPLLVSISLVIVALALFLGLVPSLTVALVGVLYTMLRLGFNIGFGVTMSDASAQVPPRLKSDQNSLFSMMQQFAGSFGTAVMSAVISARMLGASTVDATVTGSRVDFAILLVLGACMLATIVVSFRAARARAAATGTGASGAADAGAADAIE